MYSHNEINANLKACALGAASLVASCSRITKIHSGAGCCSLLSKKIPFSLYLNVLSERILLLGRCRLSTMQAVVTVVTAWQICTVSVLTLKSVVKL